MVFRRRCPYCRSRKWRKEAHSGALICSEGHVLPDHLYRNETTEATEIVPHALRKRTLKSNKIKKERISRANPILYHGERARFHYYQCLQLLLRMQVDVLTELWKLPPEFETLCRDIWALHLSLSPAPPPPEPYTHTQAHDGKDPAPDEKGKKEEDKADEKSDEERSDASNKDKDDSDESEASSNSESDDPEMIELLREASESESESDPEASRPLGTQESQARRPAKRRRGDDSPAGTIAVLVQACWMLRIPFIYNDLIRLIEDYTLPYLDPIRLLPHSLVRHLTKQTKQALTPHFAPTPVLLHTISSRLSKSLFQHYGIFTPEFNASPVLWRAVLQLGGNASLYSVAKAIARQLELPLTLNASMAPPALRKFNTDPTAHKSDNVPPEIALIATVIMGVKMIYGLDGRDVCPGASWDPACTMPTLEGFLRQMTDAENDDDARWGPVMRRPRSALREGTGQRAADALAKDAELGVDVDVDAYLAFCERALLPDKEQETGMRAGAGERLLAEYFPIERPKVRERPAENGDMGGGERRYDVPVKELPAIEIVEEGGLVRPGERYAMYSAQDVLGSLPEDYEHVVKRGEKWTGVGCEDLCAVVERFERRLERVWKRQRREAGEVEQK